MNKSIKVMALTQRKKELTLWADKYKLRSLKEIRIEMSEYDAAILTFSAYFTQEASVELLEIFKNESDTEGFDYENVETKEERPEG